MKSKAIFFVALLMPLYLVAMEDPNQLICNQSYALQTPTMLTVVDHLSYHPESIKEFQKIEYVFFEQHPSEEQIQVVTKILGRLAHQQMRPFPPALYMLGMIRLSGWGPIEADFDQAENFLWRAARHGHQLAQHQLSMIYLQQAATPRVFSNQTAFQWGPSAHLTALSYQFPPSYQYAGMVQGTMRQHGAEGANQEDWDYGHQLINNYQELSNQQSAFEEHVETIKDEGFIQNSGNINKSVQCDQAPEQQKNVKPKNDEKRVKEVQSEPLRREEAIEVRSRLNKEEEQAEEFERLLIELDLNEFKLKKVLEAQDISDLGKQSARVKAVCSIMNVLLDKKNNIAIIELLKAILLDFNEQNFQDFVQKKIGKRMEAYLEKDWNPILGYWWGKFLCLSKKEDEGYLYIVHASEGYPAADWYKNCFCLQGGTEDQAFAIKMINKLKKQNYIYDHELLQNINDTIEILKQYSDNPIVAHLLMEIYRDGIENFVAPNKQMMVFYHDRAGVQKQSTSKQKKIEYDFNSNEIASNADVNRIIQRVKEYVCVNGNILPDDIKILKAIITSDSEHVTLKNFYELGQLLLPLKRKLALIALEKAETLLWNLSEEQSLLEKDPRLALIKEDDLYQVLLDYAQSDLDVSYLVALVLILRCKYGVNLESGGVDESYLKAISLLEYLEEAQFDCGADTTILQLLKQAQFQLACYHYDQGEFEKAVQFLKPGVKRRHVGSLAYYGELCALGKIIINGLNTQVYGIEILKIVLSKKSLVDESVYRFAQDALFAAYRQRLEKSINTPGVMQARKELLENIPFYTKEGVEAVKAIEKEVWCYTLDEILAKNQEQAESGDIIALRDISLSCMHNEKYDEALQCWLHLAKKGVFIAHHFIALLMHKNKIPGSTDEILKHISTFFKFGFENHKRFKEIRDCIDESFEIICSLGEAGSLEARYLAALYCAKVYEYTENDEYLDLGVRSMVKGDSILFDRYNLEVRAEAADDIELLADKKLINALGVIDLLEGIAYHKKKDELAYILGNIHFMRYKESLAFFQTEYEHLMKALELFMKAKELGQQCASYEAIANIYYILSFKQNTPEAVLDHLNWAIEHNARHIGALMRRAELLIKYPKLCKTLKMAADRVIKDLDIAGKEGSNDALLQLSSFYIFGFKGRQYFVKDGVKKARALLKKIIKETGDLKAKLLLGKMLTEGGKLLENYPLAEHYLRFVLQAGFDSHQEAELYLGKCLLKKALQLPENVEKEALFVEAANLLQSISVENHNYYYANLLLAKIYLSQHDPDIDAACQRFKAFFDNCKDFETASDKEYEINEDFKRYKSRTDVKILLGMYEYFDGRLRNDYNSINAAIGYLELALKDNNYFKNLGTEEARAEAQLYLAASYTCLLSALRDMDDDAIKKFICGAGFAMISALGAGIVEHNVKNILLKESVEYLRNLENVFSDIFFKNSNLAEFVYSMTRRIAEVYPSMQELLIDMDRAKNKA